MIANKNRSVRKALKNIISAYNSLASLPQYASISGHSRFGDEHKRMRKFHDILIFYGVIFSFLGLDRDSKTHQPR